MSLMRTVLSSRRLLNVPQAYAEKYADTLIRPHPRVHSVPLPVPMKWFT